MSRILAPLSNEALSIVIDAVYEHYKKLHYKVLAVARHSETLEELVIYQALYGEKEIWVRPVTNFLENVAIEGKRFSRFTRIEAGRDP